MKKFILNNCVFIQKLNNSTVLFDSNNSLLFTLNDTASFILTKLLKQESPMDILIKLEKKYDIDKSNAKKDLDYFIKDLKKKELILTKGNNI
jgi:hypothetical protein